MLKEVITADEAAKKGFKKYFTGVACKNGHICERWVCDATCAECAKIKTKKYQQKNKERLSVYKKEYRKQNISKLKKRDSEYRQHNREKRKEYCRKWRVTVGYGKEYLKKKIAAAGRDKPSKCDICEKTELKICYDHCHETGLFRGWICKSCNSALGFVKDDIQILNKLIEYVKKFRGNYELSNNSAYK